MCQFSCHAECLFIRSQRLRARTHTHTWNRRRPLFSPHWRHRFVWTFRGDLEGLLTSHIHLRPKKNKNTYATGQVFVFSKLLTFEKERKAWWMCSLLNQFSVCNKLFVKAGPKQTAGGSSKTQRERARRVVGEASQEEGAVRVDVWVCERCGKLDC